MKKTYKTPSMRIVSIHFEHHLLDYSFSENAARGNSALSNKKENGTISWGVSDWEEDKGWNVDL